MFSDPWYLYKRKNLRSHPLKCKEQTELSVTVVQKEGLRMNPEAFK